MAIYKIWHSAEWRAAERAGSYAGSSKDIEDGFLHFSGAEQLRGTLDKYYAGATDLVLVAVDETKLGDALKYEPSRDGALFPHLYAPLLLSAVLWAKPLTAKDRAFVLPAEVGLDGAARHA